MPNQKKGKATPKSTPSKATPKPSPKGRGVKAVTPKKAESPKASQKPTTPQRESRSSTPSKVVESPKLPAQKKTATPPKVAPKGTKASPKGKGSPKSTKTTPKKVASPKSRPVESISESESEDENTEFKVGDLIDAQWDDGLFYSAKVIKVNKLKSGNTYNIEFTQDKVQIKNLKRSQIQSYTDDSDGEVSHKHKASNDDQEYVEGEEIPLRYDDESVESDSTEQPRARKAGRKPSSNKRKREAAPVQAPNAEKKRRLAEALNGLDEKQLVSLVKKACSSNVEILEAIEAHIPEPKTKVTKPKAAPKKPAAEKKAPQKNAPKTATATQKGKVAAPTKKAGARKGTRSGNK